MATSPTSARASRAPISRSGASLTQASRASVTKPKEGLFGRIGKFLAGQPSSSQPPKKVGPDEFTRNSYSIDAPRNLGVVTRGRISATRSLPPDNQIVAFLNQISTNGIT